MIRRIFKVKTVRRPRFLERIRNAFEIHPVVALLGPRQCGKTTLAGMFVEAERARLPRVTFLTEICHLVCFKPDQRGIV